MGWWDEPSGTSMGPGLGREWHPILCTQISRLASSAPLTPPLPQEPGAQSSTGGQDD